MNITHNTKSKRFIAAFGVAAATAVTPAVLLAGAGTAHADPCYGELENSYYCSPGAGAYNPAPVAPAPPMNTWNALPGCTGGVLEALDGEC